MISNSILLIIILMAIIAYFSFVLPKHDKILFSLYKYRDELALYAMNNNGIQEKEEYKYLIGMINAEIYLIKNNISFTDYFKTTVETTVENEQRVENIIEKIKKDEIMAKIFEQSFEVFSKYFMKKMNIFYKIVLEPANKLLSGIIKVIDLSKKAESYKRIGNAKEFTNDAQKVFTKYVSINTIM